MMAVTPRATGQLPIKIRAQNIDFYYGTFQALHHVNLDIPDRQITAFIGPSGCGKSTFLRCFNRMNDLIVDARMTGSLTMDDMDLYGPDVDPVELRRHVGMVFQKANPFPMSVYDNVAYGPRIHGIKKRSQLDHIVEDSLTKAALWKEVRDKLKSSALALSGGQQQRLCIARTLAVNAQVILMDEPCSALDPMATSLIEDLMLELRQDYTVVIVTHNMGQAQRASDWTAYFRDGEIREFAATDELFVNPRLPETQDYISGRFG